MRRPKAEGNRHKEWGKTSSKSEVRSSKSRERSQTLAELRSQGVVCLTKAQMAAALQISQRTLNKMMARGEISYFRVGRKLVRFRVEEALKRMSETVLVAADGGDR